MAKKEKASEPATAAPLVEGAAAGAGADAAPSELAPGPLEQPDAPAPQPRRFRVWPYGALHVSGAVFGPGEELPMSEAEVEQLGVGPVVEAF